MWRSLLASLSHGECSVPGYQRLQVVVQGRHISRAVLPDGLSHVNLILETAFFFPLKVSMFSCPG